MSSTGTVGRFLPRSGVQEPPLSQLTHRPRSVPANSTSAFFGCSRTTLRVPPAGRLAERLFHVWPKSEVKKR